MADFTDDLGFTLQEDNENPDTWGQVLNEGVIELLTESQVGGTEKGLIDITASLDINLTITDGVQSDVTATGTNKARCGILRLTGTLSNDIDITLPTVNNRYIIIASDPSFADGGNFVNFKTTNSTNTVSINSGDIAFFVTTPTELYPIIQTGSGGGASLLAINNLSDVANARQAIDNLGLYPIGSTYISTSAVNPGGFLPGTWQAQAEGRVLIGVGTGTDDAANNRTINVGEQAGEYDHQLTEDELAAHTHTETRHTFQTGDDFGPGQGIRFQNVVTVNSGSTGGDQSHNNMMPYLGVYIWERIA
jgi:hypothetical protein